MTLPKFFIQAIISTSILIPGSNAFAVWKYPPAGAKMEDIRKQICGKEQPTFSNAQPNSVEEKKSNERLLLIYRQLWNLYMVRNDSKITDPTKRAEIEKLMNTSRPPCLTSDQPADYVRSEIQNNSVQLIIQLSQEIGSAADDYTRAQAKSNAIYLTKELLPRLQKNEPVIQLTNEQFKSKFNLTERKKEVQEVDDQSPPTDSQERILEITRSSETKTAN
jgi:hypothetical protein